MTQLKMSVADMLERELEPTIREWLRRVNLVPDLTNIPLSDADRTGHLPKLCCEIISRLRLAEDVCPPSVAAALHGQVRRAQGYSVPMLIQESRVFQVVTFRTLDLHHSELDQNQVLLDVMIIADEVDAQLVESVRSLTGTTLSEGAA
ncbi:MAG TPA: hypothetical protein VN946_15450 [Terriglobales bacterium]|jgi:hypothetical protein|nr:hypothetical protein [Terriglobales bacterium]